MNKNKIRKIISMLSVASVVVMATAPSASADFQAINQNTGFSSVNTVVATLEDNFAWVNENEQTVVNEGEAAIFSGGNIIILNAGPTEAVTGIVEVDGQFENNSNTNEISHTGLWFFEPGSQNNSTGAFSENLAVAAVDQSIEAENDNSADVENTMAVLGVSGNNELLANMGSALLETGDIEAALGTSNTLNSNYLELSSTSGLPGDTVAVNDTTGAGSENSAVVVVDVDIEANNENDAEIENEIYSLLSSGGNVVSLNAGDTEVETGDVESDVFIENVANSNETVVDADFAGAEIAAGNFTTGADSDNSALAELDVDIEVSNENDADIENDVETAALSGGNVVIGNNSCGACGEEGATFLQTGDAENNVYIANGTEDNPLNSNTTEISLGLGGSSVIAVNDTTGADSENNAVAVLDIDVEVENENDADIENNVESVSYTGGNTVAFNDGFAEVETGDASTETVILNNVNSNVTTIDLAPVSDVIAENNCTGADSENSAVSAASIDVSVTNNNQANITNNVSTVSSSGGNEVLGNTGGASVSTGSSSVVFGISNTGNSNTTEIGD